MAIRDDVITLLRQELGPGYEAATLATLLKAHALRGLRPKLEALYRSRLDDSTLVTARQAAEQALKDEIAAREAAVAAAKAQLETDLGAV